MVKLDVQSFIDLYNNTVMPFEEFVQLLKDLRLKNDISESDIDIYNRLMLQKIPFEFENNGNLIEELIQCTNITKFGFGTIWFMSEVLFDSSTGLYKFSYESSLSGFAFDKTGKIYFIETNNEKKIFASDINSFLSFLLDFKKLFSTMINKGVFDEQIYQSIELNKKINISLVNELRVSLKAPVEKPISGYFHYNSRDLSGKLSDIRDYCRNPESHFYSKPPKRLIIRKHLQ